MGQGGAEEPCRRYTCQEISGDLTPKEISPADPSQLVKNQRHFLKMP
jgi:hypothetical protein